MIRYGPSRSIAAAASSATTRVAPASSIWYRASCAVRAGLTGVTAAPSRHAANMLVMSSTRFGSMMASTPPGRSPAACKTPASAVTRSAKPVLSSSWRSSAMQAPRGSRSARSSGMVAAVTAFPFRSQPDPRGEPRRCHRAPVTNPRLSVVSAPRCPAPRVSLRCDHDSSEGMRLMTRLINIDNGGTLTDFCLVDGGEVRYTKTLTTPYDLSRCLFDGLTRVSELVYGEPALAALLQSTDYIRYSTTQGTNALVQRAGPRLGLLLADSAVAADLAATGAQEDLFAALVGDRWAVVNLEQDDDALSQKLVTRVNDLSARGARHLVVPAQRVPAPGHGAVLVQRRPAAPRRPGPPAAADLPQRRRVVPGLEVRGADHLQLGTARWPGGDPGAGR